MKIYKMLPLEKAKDAYVLKLRPKVPTVSPTTPKTHYRIIAIKDTTATICANMKKLSGGQMDVIDVDIQSLGTNSVKVGDVLCYQGYDSRFERPMISFREHQKHQHPEQLIAPDEV
jgi:hypothetical protein